MNKMKQILLFLIASALSLSAFTACAKSEQVGVQEATLPTVWLEGEQPPKLQPSDITVSIADYGFSLGNNIDVCSVFADDTNNISGGCFNYSELSRRAGMNIDIHGYTTENRILKILAQDSDIDIYIINGSEIKTLLDNKIFEPIDSDIVAHYVSKTFSSVQEICTDDDGNIIMMPLSHAVMPLLVPKKAVEELDLKPEQIEYYDDFLDYLRSYDGHRLSYGVEYFLFNCVESQYHYYHCDLPNGVFDYDNESFRKLYESTLGSYVTDENGYYVPSHSLPIGRDTFDVDNNLFSMIQMVYFINRNDPELTAKRFDEFVLYPMPKYDEKITGSVATGAQFAYINPYSKNKESALKLLETISENYFDILNTNMMYTVFSDLSMYPEEIDTNAQLFRDYIEMAENSEILLYSEDFSVTVINDDYKNKRITLDEAIAERTRVVNIMLNE